MRDHGDDRAPECADEAMRDALPALDHGRLPAAERRALEAHLERCAACVAELSLLRGARTALADRAPTVDFERLAAGVIAGTRRPASGTEVVPLAPRVERAAARPATATRWAARGGLRAAAAVLVLALGAGAAVSRLGGPSGTAADAASSATVVAAGPTRDSATGAPPAGTDASPTGPAAAGAAAATRGHVLGDGFEDLDERELAAVLDAIDDDGASLPALEPLVFAPEYLGGDG
jgi:hypothetical protein